MKVRRAARRLALDVLYEAEIRDMLPRDAWTVRSEQGWVIPAAGDDDLMTEEPEQGPPHEALGYGHDLVSGVQAHQADIDSLIARYADRWTIERMPVLDRNIVRIALYELVWGGDVPVAVVINEAVELAKSLSTDDSGRFINGLLGRIVEQELSRG
ncbi:MAG: transcription antitermination factor NusB [Actinomycetota bacterium]